MHVRARVSLDTVLAPLSKVANARDFEATARKVHARLVTRGDADAGDRLAGEPLSVLQAAVGPLHACAVLADRTVACWGTGTLGELGVRVNESHAPIPRRVPGLADAKSVAIGMRTTCAVTTAGDVHCWGAGASGQLGAGAREKGTDQGETPYSASPVPLRVFQRSPRSPSAILMCVPWAATVRSAAGEPARMARSGFRRAKNGPRSR